MLGLASIARSRGHRDRALALFTTARELNPANLWFLIECAGELRALGRFAEADAMCREILLDAPGYAAAHHGLGVSARQAGARAQALGHFRDAWDAEPANLWNAVECVTEMRALGRPHDAEALCEQILAANPDYAAAHGALGHIRRQQGHHRAALDHFERAVACEPGNMWFVVERAADLRALGRAEEAERALKEAAAIRPDLAVVDHGLGLAARQRRDHAAALAHFEEAARKEPGNLWFRLDCAVECRNLGRPDEAQRIYEEAGQVDPGNAHVVIGLGITARMRGLHEEAAALMDRAVSMESENPYFRAEYGHELVGLGRLEEAREQFDAALGMPGGAVVGQRGLATLARLRNDNEEELRLLQALSEGQPRQADVSLLYIQRYSAIRGPAQTLQHFFANDDVEAMGIDLAMEYAANLRSAGRAVEAGAVVSRLATGQARDERSTLRLATEARRVGLFELCQTLLAQISAGGAPSVAALLEKARLERVHASVEQASQSYLAAFRRQPGDIDVANEVLAFLREHRRFDEADALIREGAISAAAPARLFAQLVSLLCDRGATTEARQLVEERAALFPDRDELLLWRADIALAEGATETAFALVRQVIDGSSHNQEAWGRLAHFAALSDEYDLALRALGQLNPDRPELEATKSYYQSQLGLHDQALATLDTAEARYGEVPTLVMARCRIWERIGMIEEAMLLLTDACDRYPADTDLLMYRAVLGYRTGKGEHPDEAIFPSEAHRQLVMGHAAMRRRAIDAAIGHFKAAQPDLPSPDLCRNLALMHMCALDFNEARVELRAALEIERRARQAKQQSMNESQSLYGQLLDEYRLDGNMAAEIRSALSGIPDVDVGSVLDIARNNPDSTLAAVILLIKMRQAGMLDAGQARRSLSRIPRRICQFWADGEPGDELKRYTDSWIALNPGYAYALLTSEDGARFLAAGDFRPEVSAAFRAAREPAVKADILRLAYLSQNGGFYADIDDRCVKSLEHVRASGATFFGYQEDIGSLANNILGVIPGHPVIGWALDRAVEAVLRGDGDMPWLSTGPGLLSRAFAYWLAHAEGTLAETLSTVLIPDYPASFEHFSIHCFASYKITPQHWGRRMFG